ncbi:MAG TPA: Ig-like domain-containing protein, partial [Polyangiaceae bacterium LLY-WYZ-14_1]|nr:Ig-like domain-containing protein [Polyangiaceae bacterium LLY-WYZ-14_1]
MTSKHARRGAAALALVLAATACERDLTDLDPAGFPSTSAVFIDGFGPGVDFDAFELSKVDALNIDDEVFYGGTASLRFDVPDSNDPSGGFVGGTFSSMSGRDLSGYNALTFWARSDRTVTLDLVGFGLDGAGNNRYQTELTALELNATWRRFAVPIPDAGVLTREGGFFFLSEGNQIGDPYSVWIDEVQFVDLPTVGTPQAEVFSRDVAMAVDDVVQAEASVTIPVGGEILDVGASAAYFDWSSSDPSVASVSESGLITKLAGGTADISATLGGAPVSGLVSVRDGDGLAGVVFDDAFGAGVGFASFGDNAKTDAVSTDDTEAYRGTRSIRVTVPGEGDPSGFFAGGVFRTGPTDRRDLTGFNALVFWAKAAKPASLDVAGFGNDNEGTSRFPVQRSGLPLSTEWRRFVVPVPDPARLDAVRGLFTFAEGTEDGAENTIWFDEIAFVALEELGTVQPTLASQTVTIPVGETTQVGFDVSFPVGGETVSVDADARYFSWSTSDPAVATVSESGLVTMVGEGSAQITATLAGVPAAGVLTVQTSAPTIPPDAPAPAPTQDAADVIAIYSNSYPSVPNEGLNRYGAAGFEEVDVAQSGNTALAYTFAPGGGGNFQIIELGGANAIDAAGAGMTHFRFDVWVSGEVTNDEFVIGLVNIDPANPPATRGDVRVSGRSTPAIAQGRWLSFDVPLADLTSLGGTGHIQQVV